MGSEARQDSLQIRGRQEAEKGLAEQRFCQTEGARWPPCSSWSVGNQRWACPQEPCSCELESSSVMGPWAIHWRFQASCVLFCNVG